MTGSDFFTVVVMAIAVYAPKAVPILLIRDRLPNGVRQWLEYVPPAILAALVAPAIFTQGGSFQGLTPVHAAFLVAAVAAALSRRALPSVLAGLATLLLVSVLFPRI